MRPIYGTFIFSCHDSIAAHLRRRTLNDVVSSFSTFLESSRRIISEDLLLTAIEISMYQLKTENYLRNMGYKLINHAGC